MQYTVEYILRLWSCGCHGRFKGYAGRLKFARRFFSILGESKAWKLKKLYTLDLTTLIVTALVFFESLCMKLSDSTEQGKESRVLATSVLRALRFLQVVRMIRVDRRLVSTHYILTNKIGYQPTHFRGSSWKLLASVINTHTKELLTAIYLGLLTLIFLSYLIYQIEHQDNVLDTDEPQMFDSFADALWWGIVTLTTVGKVQSKESISCRIFDQNF